MQDGLSIPPPLAIPISQWPEIYIKLSSALKERTIYGLKFKQLFS